MTLRSRNPLFACLWSVSRISSIFRVWRPAEARDATLATRAVPLHGLQPLTA